MTHNDVLDVLSVVAIKWPNSNLGERQAAAANWLDALGAFDRDDVAAAVKRLAAAGREFAPTADQVAQEVQLALQGPPPSFDEVQAFLSRHIRCLPYGQANTPSDTVTAIEQLADAGAHEAVLRFVVAHGVYAARMMPDPTLQALDPNQLADRRDRARDYTHRVLADWRRDPRPGVALAQAIRQLEPGRAGLRKLDPAGLLPGPGES